MSLIPRLKPFIGLREVVAALSPSSGKIIQYEKAFAAKFGCEYGVMFSHGRSALYALLKSWNLSNDEIICPAYTCVVVQHAVVLSGNVPVFVDCEKDQPNMDLKLLESTITEKTRAVIATHLFGYPMNVVELQQIVERAEKQYGHKIYVIQDVAHSYGAEWNGKLVTTFGDAAFFGSNISKIMTSIFGGMLITNSKQTFDAIHSYRADNFKKSGFVKALNRFVYLIAIVIAFNEVIY
jgi:perosamine synthetase